ncbi:PREDICTED: early light-induced protein 1, chloroplastic-like [Fragaria vesca subsp. vesca]|uniref:early light-induced protein 1, chloroplastic-like n=1 Tax=Fragaria vesca subsp. vesca TaxID=101020 RepID=UPI0002C36876|nr:PREDICTED: early light-induced protein 1, chloroplastic-like [Fragaria vesca subsp. vesca]
MATTTVMQSILGSSVAYGAAGKNRSLMKLQGTVPASYPVSSYLRVRSMAEDGQKKQPTTVTTASKNPQPAEAPSPPPPSTKFSDVFAFSGPAPERINGRLAMVGFVAALAVELSKGQDVFAQISSGSGVPLFIGTSVLLSVASLVPLLKGVTVESKSNGIMTSDAELWNGRLAMLGLVALAFTEYVTGTTLV